MGCGGSRADAIEPRYYESWTRETESTWLTYTDSDAPPSNAAPDSGPEAGGLHAGSRLGPKWEESSPLNQHEVFSCTQPSASPWKSCLHPGIRAPVTSAPSCR
ncbi:brain and acute leukemia cytoplasmic protein isoform X2 [Cervus elaphus]|uniref:brain and acute leukemia cytoplasmic protein isoform X2 n=1 Tax=Cervus canadensis TaxID=1574408 RepID=UPI001C9E9193|nr:brain and acute leukemia cytoplasmic protein isoform X2 [Cervus canadensis]XP_043736248.1 brain and acute leukemia cytoplasmic protein isoform X2 [Cervus elaphus]